MGMHGDEQTAVRRKAYRDPTVFGRAMIFIEYGEGARVTKDRHRSLEAHAML
jgi:hypothetical protein